jgi:N6-adenosine-specific RNA methylase IME4/ParB-like chromosome segregation protein Spo0J
VTAFTRHQPVLVLPIDAIEVGTRHRKRLGDIDALATSIKEVGLLHPPVITPERTLIVGLRRIEAARLLGWTTVPVRIVDLDDLLSAEADENNVRLDFTPSEAVAIAAALREREAQKAKARQREHGGTAPGRPNTGATLAPVSTDTGKARDKVAAKVGMGRSTLTKAEVVVSAAEADPELAAIAAKMDSTGNVNAAYRAVQKKRIVAVIEAEPRPLPTGPFRVIVADPPWAYENRAEDGTHRAANPYPSMSLDDIRALPVEGVAHDDAILWLWTTNAFMEHAFGIARVWGFEPKTILTWAKDRMGTGEWLRGQTEHALMAVRGHPTVTLTNQTTLLHAPMREHSRKPDEFYALVEALCPGSKLELFARGARPGWRAWGAEGPRAAA